MVDCPAGRTVTQDGNYLCIDGPQGIGYRFHRFHGTLCGILKDGENLLLAEARPGLWRAPTDNDRHIKNKWGLFEDNAMGWNMNRLFHKCYKLESGGDGGDFVVRTECSLAGVARTPIVRYRAEYRVHPDGSLGITVKANRKEDSIWLPRFGFEFTLGRNMEEMEYFGKGPWENYCDMDRHVTVGRYRTTVSAEYVPYVKPQEHGNHTAVRELALWDGQSGRGLTFTGSRPFCCQASHYSAQELTEKKHDFELELGDTYVRIDYGVSGIGSNSCGPELPVKYRLDETEMEYGFTISVR